MEISEERFKSAQEAERNYWESTWKGSVRGGYNKTAKVPGKGRGESNALQDRI